MTTIDEMHDHHDAARRSDRWALPLAALGGILVLVSMLYLLVALGIGLPLSSMFVRMQAGGRAVGRPDRRAVLL